MRPTYITGHAVADVAHHTQVVRPRRDRSAENSACKSKQEVQDLGLHRNVQGRDRLVGDDQARMQGQGAGDADALSLAR